VIFAGKQRRNDMAKVIFLDELCKGCGLCVGACPKKIVHLSENRLNAKGYHPAEVTETDKCIGCAFCGTMCPDCVITVEK
jgi:2-oxoglutarate ferredoxin oxidoreductase subunit delta